MDSESQIYRMDNKLDFMEHQQRLQTLQKPKQNKCSTRYIFSVMRLGGIYLNCNTFHCSSWCKSDFKFLLGSDQFSLNASSRTEPTLERDLDRTLMVLVVEPWLDGGSFSGRCLLPWPENILCIMTSTLLVLTVAAGVLPAQRDPLQREQIYQPAQLKPHWYVGGFILR